MEVVVEIANVAAFGCVTFVVALDESKLLVFDQPWVTFHQSMAETNDGVVVVLAVAVLDVAVGAYVIRLVVEWVVRYDLLELQLREY